jgi:hypothetical protein
MIIVTLSIYYHTFATVNMCFAGWRASTNFLNALVSSHAVVVMMTRYISDSCHTETIVADFSKRTMVIQITYGIGAIICIGVLVIDTHHSFPMQRII